MEQGETNASGFFRPAPVPAKAKEDKPQFSGEWKTRYEWDPEELAAIAAAAAGVRPGEVARAPAAGGPAGPKNIVQADAKKAVVVTPPRRSPPGQPAPPKPVVVPAPPAGPAALEQPVPRPVKTPAPAAAAPAAPAPGRAADPGRQ